MSAVTENEDAPESGFQSRMAQVFSASLSAQVPFYVGFAGLVVLVLAWGDTLSLSIDLFLHPAETACAPGKSSEVCASEHYQRAIDQFRTLAFVAAVGVSLYAYLARFLPNRERAVRGDVRRWGRLLVSLSGFIFFSQCAQLAAQVIGEMFGGQADAPADPLSESTSIGAQWWQVARMMIAGAAEEPFFVGLPIVLLLLHYRSAPAVSRAVFFAVIGMSGAARGILHLYQGISPAFAAFVWGSVVVALFWRYRSLVGLIAGHAIYNAYVLAGHGRMGILVIIAVTAVAGLATLCGVFLCRRTDDPRSSPSPREPIDRTRRKRHQDQ